MDGADDAATDASDIFDNTEAERSASIAVVSGKELNDVSLLLLVAGSEKI